MYCFTDVESGHILTKITQIHLIELIKIDSIKPVAELSKIEKLAAYLKYACDEEHGDYVEEILSDTEEFAMSENRLKALTEDELEYERAWARHMWELDRGTEAIVRAELEKELEEATKLNSLMLRLAELNRIDDLKKATVDKEFKEALYREFGL